MIFTPLWGKQGTCHSAHLGQSDATRTQELGSPCPVLCKTLSHRGGSRPEQYTIRGALLKKKNSKISYFYKYYKHRWPCYYVAREPPQTLRRNRASAGPWMVSLLGSMFRCCSSHVTVVTAPFPATAPVMGTPLPLTQPAPFWLSSVRNFLIPSWNLLLEIITTPRLSC